MLFGVSCTAAIKANLALLFATSLFCSLWPAEAAALMANLALVLAACCFCSLATGRSSPARGCGLGQLLIWRSTKLPCPLSAPFIPKLLLSSDTCWWQVTAYQSPPCNLQRRTCLSHAKKNRGVPSQPWWLPAPPPSAQEFSSLSFKPSDSSCKQRFLFKNKSTENQASYRIFYNILKSRLISS